MVQGEGRGHMTQALALARYLRDAGHELVVALVGRSRGRLLPAYFARGIEAPVVTFPAPQLAPDAARRGISLARTAVRSLVGAPTFTASTLRLMRELSPRRVDVVVNFYDLLTGISRLLSWSRAPSVVLAHHFILDHPDVPVPDPRAIARWGLRSLSTMCALRSEAELALSFDELAAPPQARFRVVPPLLRPELATLDSVDGGHLLAYALNPGYGEEIAAWHERTPDAPVRCFIEGGAAGVDVPERPGLTFHELDDRAFLAALASCRAYVGTAGFESVCEAFYLGKPTLVVPTAGHYEQRFNALDAQRVGAATPGTYADLDRFWRDLPAPDPAASERFRAWVARGPELIVSSIEAVAA